MKDKERLLTVQQVASHLQLNFRTVYDLLRSSRLAGIKVGRVWRVRPEALEDYLKENSRSRTDR